MNEVTMKMKMKAISFMWALAAILCNGPSLMCVKSSMLLSSPLVASIHIKYNRRIHSFNNSSCSEVGVCNNSSSSSEVDVCNNDGSFISTEHDHRTVSSGSMHDDRRSMHDDRSMHDARRSTVGYKKDQNDGVEVITHHDNTEQSYNAHGETANSRRSQKSFDIISDVHLSSNRDDDRRGPSNSSSSSSSSNNRDDVKHDSPAVDSSSSLRFKRFNFIHHTMKNFLSHFIRDPDILDISTDMCSLVAWVYILLSVVGTVGFDTKPMLSLLGIGGITLGFSLKDILSDMYYGVYVLFTKPFKRGSIISVAEYEGRVVSMDVRYVKLFSIKDNCIVLVPLPIVYKNAIRIKIDGDHT